MSKVNRAVDAANKQVQFELSDSAQSIGFKLGEFTPEQIDAVKVRVELISKNKTNQTLYDLTYGVLRRILKFAYPNLMNVLPFAIGKTLNLNDDNRLLITLNFANVLQQGEEGAALNIAAVPANFQYEVNKYVETTNNPLVLKKVKIEEETEFNTEFYPLLMIPQDVDSYETLVMVPDEVQKLQPHKVFFEKNILNSLIGDSQQIAQGGINLDENTDLRFLPMVTYPEQKVKITGNTNVYLALV